MIKIVKKITPKSDENRPKLKTTPDSSEKLGVSSSLLRAKDHNLHPKDSSQIVIDLISLTPVHKGKPKNPPSSGGIPARNKNRNFTKVSIVKELESLLNSTSEMCSSKFCFDISQESSEHNFKILKENNFDLHGILNNTPVRSVTSYRSEFKTVEELDNLLINHPRWPRLRTILKEGSVWPLKDISIDHQQQDLKASIVRGNHKSALKHNKVLSKALEKEIVKGWELILPLDKASEIPGLVLSPMGVVKQMGIDKSGNFVPKTRVTHDLSFPGLVSQESINSRVDPDKLDPCMFGYTFLHIIHRIVHLQSLHPSKIIWIRKTGCKICI